MRVLEIKILTQIRDKLIAVESIETKKDAHHLYALVGKKNGEQFGLGHFKSSINAERVLLNIVKRHNLLPDSICIIPEDDADIMDGLDISALPGQVSDV